MQILKLMKRIEFPLTRPVRLTPLSGQTLVELTTTGDVLVADYVPARPYCKRNVPVVNTERGQITSSPKGYYLTLKVIQPAEMATEREFHRQVDMLFDEMNLDRI